MTIMRKTYTLIVMLAMMFSSNAWGAWGEDVTIGDFVYNFDGKKARISAYNGNATSLTFGDVEYEGVTYKVTEIASEVFKNNTTLENVTWQAYLTEGTTNIYYYIRAGAFEGCTNLKTFVTDGSQRMYLYSRAFKNCSSLTQFGGTVGRVLLRSNTSVAQEEVFMGCTSITYLSYMFGGTKIGDRWFKDCTSLKTLNLGNAGAIGESAFEGCTAITGFNVTAGQTASASTLTIGKNAFKGCTAITYAQFDQVKRVTTAIPEGMFEGCISLASVTSASNTSGSATYRELNGITSIGANAFNGCTALTRYGITANKVTFANDLAEIGASAFAGCDAITNVVAPWTTPIVITEDVFSTTVYENATLDYPEASLDAYKAATGWQKFFKDASAFTAVFNLLGTDGETVVGTMNIHIKTNETGGAMVYNDDAVAAQKLDGDAGILDLRVVKDGDDNTYPLVEIGKNAFKGVADITDVWFTANELTTIGESAFENCENLVAFSSNAAVASVVNIGAYAFKGTSLGQVGTAPGKYLAATSTYSTASSPLTIGDEAFKGTRIQFVVNGGNIRQLGEGVFEDCTMLKNNGDSILYLSNAALTTIPARTFKNCTNLVYVSGGVNNKTAIGESAFEGCTKLARVTMDTAAPSTGYLRLSNKLTAIGANAFKDCSALSRIILNTLTPPTLGEDAFTGIKANSYFYINPNNSYKSASKYALNDGWKVYFNGTKASHYLIAYVNKEKQYGTVSCDVPLYFYATSAIANLYKVIASSDNYAYMETVSSKILPAETGAVIDVEVDGTVKTSTAVQVLFSTVSATDWSDNLLVANVEENTNFVGNEGNTWNLIMNDGKFVRATGGTLAGGLAYLPVTFEGGEAKELSLTTDEPTGIKTIDNGEPTVDNGAWYTIDGTRLQGEPTMKGIYIKNGKKIVVK